jgi:hypothetical protein
LKKDSKETTFYKPKRYQSIHTPNESNTRLTPFRQYIQSHQPEHINLTRNFTSKKLINHLPLASKVMQDQSNEFLRRTLTESKPSPIKVDTIERNKFAIAFKNTSSKHHKFEEILGLIEKKER